MKRLRAVTMSAQRLATDPVSPAPEVPIITLLVADGDNRTVRALQRRLQAGGYGVIVANRAEQVFRTLHEKHPSAVILGENLRDTDGKTVCRQIKLDSTAIYVPVILIADHDQDGDWNEDPSPSAPDATLCKPVDGGELLEWLRLLLGFKRQFDYRMKKLVTQVQTAELVKSDIINNVSHEIATPLLQVKSAVSLLAEDIARHGSREQARVASMATQAVGRLEDVVNNIRQLARAHNIELGPVVLDEAVDLAIRHVERSWTWRGARARIRKQVDEDLPDRHPGRRTRPRLRSVLPGRRLQHAASGRNRHRIGAGYAARPGDGKHDRSGQHPRRRQYLFVHPAGHQPGRSVLNSSWGCGQSTLPQTSIALYNVAMRWGSGGIGRRA
jgi:DNA-binding response OmpR family regulator